MADGYFPESIAEAAKIGGTAIAAVIIAKKVFPKQSAQFGLSDGLWMQNADGSWSWAPPGAAKK